MKTSIASVLITLPLICFVLLRNAQAVVPAPDGGYPGGNTAEGTSALANLTTGVWNTALGYQALTNLTTGNQNTAIGFQALLNTTTGSLSVATGSQALYHNSTGSFNTATGFRALYSNTTGSGNTGNGFEVLGSNTAGVDNTAIGYRVLHKNTSGRDNTANGFQALLNNTTGDSNTADGWGALFKNTIGPGNTAHGVEALYNNVSGGGNTADGAGALHGNNGESNTAIGAGALAHNISGSNNVALGVNAGFDIDGNNNIDIGGGTFGLQGESDTIRVGTVGTHTRTFIAGISGSTVPSGVSVIIDVNGQLGTINSSARYKEAIRPMDNASEAILGLRPVTFRYKHELDPNSIAQFGLVAEEVEKIDPDLVARDGQGKPYTVRYEAVNAMLLNEFLKEHRKVQEQESTISELKSTVAQQQKDFQATVEQLTKRLDEQASQIQKVSAQLAVASPSHGGLEVNRQAPQVVSNNQ